MSGVRMWQCVLLCCCCCAADGMAECAAAAWLLRCCAADDDEVRTSLLMRVANGRRLKSDWKSANISLSYFEATCAERSNEVRWGGQVVMCEATR